MPPAPLNGYIDKVVRKPGQHEHRNHQERQEKPYWQASDCHC